LLRVNSTIAVSLLLACAAPRGSTAAKSPTASATAPAMHPSDERSGATPAAKERVENSPSTLAGNWREARWGMTVEEVLAAFPGEAFRLDPELRLADGAVVAAGIEHYAIGAHDLRVRFVFERDGLALVSLRTPPSVYAEPAVFEELESHLRFTHGEPATIWRDRDLIDLRQTRWVVGGDAIDLEYIPGVAVLMYRPAETSGAQ
jgi:hypothetical protein